MKKVVHCGVNAHSFDQAEIDVQTVGELNVSAQRIRRAVKQIGKERIADRDQEIDQWQSLTLSEQRESPVNDIPSLACVQCDGGRIQIRQRCGPTENVERADGGRFWRETKVGCLLRMTSEEHEQDPCPLIPKTFIDPSRIDEIAREIKGFWGESPDDEDDLDEDTIRVKTESQRRERPIPLVKSVVATRQNSDSFGLQLAAATYKRGFFAADRKVFVADGQSCNWTIWKRHFSHFTPVLDFVHAICYVYSAAMAGGETKANWQRYCRWAQWLWAGDVQRIIEQLQQEQQAIGLPAKNEPEGTPQQRVNETLVYLTNQQSRTNYAEYRCKGLPLTSCYIESTIKQINRRVKGSEKFWSELAEHILQLTADNYSQTGTERFWQQRPTKLTGLREYQSSA